MKNILVSILILMTLFGQTAAQTGNRKANELVSFLEGTWHDYTVYMAKGTPVDRQNYTETMSIKNDSTLTITAHNYKDGKDVTRDMILVIDNDNVVMRQGNFEATGRREGNAYSLTGYADNKEYRFRLYMMGDTYIFHSETWGDGNIEAMNMSYLVRE